MKQLALALVVMLVTACAACTGDRNEPLTGPVVLQEILPVLLFGMYSVGGEKYSC